MLIFSKERFLCKVLTTKTLGILYIRGTGSRGERPLRVVLCPVTQLKGTILVGVRLAAVNLPRKESHGRGVTGVVIRELFYMCFSRQEKSERGQRPGKGSTVNVLFI